MTNISKPPLLYITYFRAFAILTIILGHTFRLGQGNFLDFQCNLYCFNTALFVFISGYLFEYLSYKFDYKIYLKKKFFNVVLPYFVIIIPLSLMSALASPEHNTFHNLPFYQKFLGGIIFGQTVIIPTWFIGMIIWFYLLAPLFLRISRSKNFGLILGCSIVYTILSPVLVVTQGLSSSVFFDFGDISLHFILFFIESFFHFLSYYLLGIFFCQMKERHPQKIQQYQMRIFKYSLYMFLFSSFVFLIVPLSPRSGVGFTKLLSCIAFYFCFTIYEHKISNNAYLSKTLNFLSGYSFGIFFIHECFVNWFNFHTFYELNIPPLFMDLSVVTFHNFILGLAFFVAVLLLSCLTLWVLRFILSLLGVKHTRWFIGV